MEELHDDDIQKCLVDDEGAGMLLVRLLVKEDRRRRGAGGRMLERVKELAKSRRKRWVRLVLEPESSDMRHDLIRFYRRHGFSMMRDNETMILYT